MASKQDDEDDSIREDSTPSSRGKKRPRHPRASSSVDKDRQLKKIKREQINEGCEVCGERFVTYAALESHRDKDHLGWNDPEDSQVLPSDGSILHPCTKCKNAYRYRSALVLHSYMHWNYPFVCNHCGNGVTSREMLGAHKMMHSKIYQCEQCGRIFSGKDSLRKHRKNLTCNGVEDKEYEFHCYTCSASFPSSAQKKEHVKANHMGIVTCEECGMDFIGPDLLASHICGETTNHQYCCDHCRRRFVTFQQLTNHLLKHKAGGQPEGAANPQVCRPKPSVFDPRILKNDVFPREYKCTECDCDKVFKDYYAFQNHMRFHAGYEAFTCNICGKTMSNKASLACHVRAHENIKPFCCDVCGKKFTEKSKLTRHNRIHTGERPYVCDQCGMSFNQSGSLKNHKRTHEREDDSTAAVHVGRSCNVCGKSFRSAAAFSRHKCPNPQPPAPPPIPEPKPDILEQAAIASDALLSLQGENYVPLVPVETAPVEQPTIHEVAPTVVMNLPPDGAHVGAAQATPTQAVTHVVSLTVSEGVSETVTQAVSQTASQAVAQVVWGMVAHGALGPVTNVLPHYTPEQLTHSLSQFVVQRLSQRMSSVAMEELPRLMTEALEKIIP